MLNHDAQPDDSANLTQSIQIPGTSYPPTRLPRQSDSLAAILTVGHGSVVVR